MSDAAQRIIENESGYRKDLRDAELQMIAAGDDPVARAVAFQRHAEAVRNMMIAEMIPSFQKALQPLLADTLDSKLSPVVIGIGGLQAGVTRLNEEFHTLSEIVSGVLQDLAESKTDRQLLHTEVTGIKTDIAALKADVDAIRNDFVVYRNGNRRGEIDAMQAQIAELQGHYSKDERERLTAVLLQMIKEYEETHFSE